MQEVGSKNGPPGDSRFAAFTVSTKIHVLLSRMCILTSSSPQCAFIDSSNLRSPQPVHTSPSEEEGRLLSPIGINRLPLDRGLWEREREREREREAVSSSFPRYQCIRQNTQASPPSSLSCSLNPSKASIHFPPPSPQSSPEALDGRKVLRYCCCSPTSGKKGAAAAASCFPPTGGKVRGRERERWFL